MPPAPRVWCECCQKLVPPSTEYRHRKGRARPHVRATYIYKKSLPHGKTTLHEDTLDGPEDRLRSETKAEPWHPVNCEQDGDVSMGDGTGGKTHTALFRHDLT